MTTALDIITDSLIEIGASGLLLVGEGGIHRMDVP